MRGRSNRLARLAERMPAGAIIAQFGWLAGAKIIQGLASTTAMLVVARTLGPMEFGTLSLSIAIASFVALLAALGLEQVATRELVINTDAPTQTLLALRRMRLIGALAGGLVLLAIAILPPVRALGAQSLVFVLALLPLAQIGDVSEWRLLAANQSRRIAIVTLLVSPLAALARCFLAYEGHGAIAFAWILVAEWTAKSIMLWWVAHESPGNITPGCAAPPLKQSLTLLRESTPILLAGIAVFAYMRIDQFMIAGMLGMAQVGLYSSMVILAELPLVIPTLILRASLPTLTRMSLKEHSQRNAELTKLMGVGIYFHAAVACTIALVAEPIVVLLYGEPYRAAAGALRILVLAAPFVALGVLSSAWLVLERKTSHALRRTLFGAITNAALNLVLIPAWGIKGAALATLVAQFLATYAADALYEETRDLFMMKTRALWPGNWS